jgi:hypothetical protein
MESRSKLTDDEFLVYNLSQLDNLPEIIEIEGTLPVNVNLHAMLAKIRRWNELSERFNRPVRIYAGSYNLGIEKLMQSLLLEYDNIYLSVTSELPKK